MHKKQTKNLTTLKLRLGNLNNAILEPARQLESQTEIYVALLMIILMMILIFY